MQSEHPSRGACGLPRAVRAVLAPCLEWSPRVGRSPESVEDEPGVRRASARILSADRIQRLKEDPTTKGIGVQPWDDGSLKLAVEAALDLRVDETAVSNAVLWSITTEDGENANPTLELATAPSTSGEDARDPAAQENLAAGAWARGGHESHLSSKGRGDPNHLGPPLAATLRPLAGW